MERAPQTQPPRSEAEAKPAKNYERRIANWTVVVGAFTIALAIATAGSGVVLWQTDHTLKDTLNHSRESAERQLRAYMYIDGGEVIYQMAAGDAAAITVNIQIKNAGQTPAYGVTSWMRPPQILPPDAPFHLTEKFL